MAKLVLKSRHRVMCGDSTSERDVAALMDGSAADLVFTSPPYAQQRDYGAAKDKVSDWDALMQGVFSALPVKNSAQVLVNLGLVHRDGEWLPYWDGWIAWMRGQGWRRFGWYVWDQGAGLPGDWNGRLAPSHEFIFHFNRAQRRPNKTKEKKPESIRDKTGDAGLREQDGTIGKLVNGAACMATHKIPDSVVRVTRHKGAVTGGSHPAVFPVALVEEIIAAYSDEGDVIYEPFAGSGTSVVAAERSGRSCFAMELDPAYVDVACRRWLLVFGTEPVHAETRKTFSEVADGAA